MNFTPSSPELLSAYALLALIADPAAAKARLDELAKATADLNVAAAAATAAQQAAADASVTQAAMAKANTADAKKNNEDSWALDARKSDLDDRALVMTAKEHDFDQKVLRDAADAATQHDALDLRRSVLDDREARLKLREGAVTQTQAEVDTLKADLDRRMALIQQFAQGAK